MTTKEPEPNLEELLEVARYECYDDQSCCFKHPRLIKVFEELQQWRRFQEVFEKANGCKINVMTGMIHGVEKHE